MAFIKVIFSLHSIGSATFSGEMSVFLVIHRWWCVRQKSTWLSRLTAAGRLHTVESQRLSQLPSGVVSEVNWRQCQLIRQKCWPVSRRCVWFRIIYLGTHNYALLKATTLLKSEGKGGLLHTPSKSSSNSEQQQAVHCTVRAYYLAITWHDYGHTTYAKLPCCILQAL